MIKDEISDNNNQCENVESITEEKVRDDYVECVSEDGLCDVGGGQTLLKSVKFDLKNKIIFYGGPYLFRPEKINLKDLKPLKNNKVQDLTPGESLPSKNDEEL